MSEQGGNPYAGQASIAARIMLVDGQNPDEPVALELDRKLRGIPVALKEPAQECLARTLLGATDTLVFTAGQKIKDMQIIVANVSAAARTFQLNHVASGGSSSDTNSLAKTMALAIGAAVAFDELGMSSGEMIRGLCNSASGVTVTVHGKKL